ncbi:hypothetical protein V6N11_083257 [Hibiscus sabdariffa]|uniref:Uncharacterized protein n=1 Tax=Hibiscus sabdariffa TaxID=183260 RepID=A0ABR2QLG7_9ROSI
MEGPRYCLGGTTGVHQLEYQRWTGLGDIDHVLRFCIRAYELWASVIKSEVVTQFYTFSFNEWLHDSYMDLGLWREIVWIGRNRVADKLATLGRSQSMEGAVYAIPPSTMVVFPTNGKHRWEDQLRTANLMTR